MKLSYLVKGFPGHPLHPPLTDATIGIYTGATASGVLAALGVSEENMAVAWWLALVAGLVVTLPTAATGFVDWLAITWGTPLWRKAKAHMLAMQGASVLFLLAAVLGHAGYVDRDLGGAPLTLTLLGFATLTLGGWLGGSIVFVHGMRVLGRRDLSASQAAAPVPSTESDAGTGGMR